MANLRPRKDLQVVALPDSAKAIFDANAFVTVGTLNANGAPQLSILWAKRDGDQVLLSTIEQRQKYRNLSRDPRISIAAPDPADPYRYVEVRGIAAMTREGGRELIDELSMKYRGQPFRVEAADVVRVVVRVTPEHVVEYG